MANDSAYEISSITFAEHADSFTDEVATAIMERPGGRHAIIAHIRKDYDPNAKRTMYRTYDTDGKEIIAPNYSLDQVKKQIRRKEQLFHEQESLKEQAMMEDMHQEERKRYAELRTLRSGKENSKSRTR